MTDEPQRQQQYGPSVPPHDLEAEQSVLGAVLLSDTAMPALVLDAELLPEHFYREAHGLIWRAMVELHQEGEPVDTLTLYDRLRSDRLIKRVGGRQAIDVLSGSVPSVGNVRAYAKTVKQMAVWRRRLAAGYEQIRSAITLSEDDWNRAIAAADAAEEDSRPLLPPHTEFWDWYDNETAGIPTPFPRLTKALGGGLVPGDMTVIGGWPGHTKSVLADMCSDAAEAAGFSSHIFLNELRNPQRIGRAVARRSDVPWPAIQARALSPSQRATAEVVTRKLVPMYERIEQWPVERIAQAIRRGRWDLVVVDLATLVVPHDNESDYRRICDGLALVAAETGTHVVAVCQLNLGRDKDKKKPRPTSRDLLGTGAWNQAAKNILFVHREQDSEGRHQPEALVFADKATHGDTSQSFIEVIFRPQRMRPR
jgi:replicative DNA helicase